MTHASDPVEQTLRAAQPGLIELPLFGAYLAIDLTDRAATAPVLDAVRRLDESARALGGFAVTAFDPALWAAASGHAAPGGPPADSIIDRDPQFVGGGSDVWVFVKTDDAKARDALLVEAEAIWGALGTVQVTPTFRRADDKVLARHLPDGITNPQDPTGIAQDVLLDEGPSRGGTWAFVQRFGIDWSTYGNLGPDLQANVIGRTGDGVLIANDDLAAHIRRVRRFDDNRNNRKMMRQAMPFGRDPSGRGREDGIYFVAFARAADVMEDALCGMAGDGEKDSYRDRLLTFVRGDFGGYYYVPSAKELGLGRGLARPKLDPFWDQRSANGLMFYNSEDYLHTMGTGAYAPGDPPSRRIQSLIAKIFSRWRDHWYFEFDIPRLPHLQQCLDLPDAEYAKIPLAVRRGLAIKTALTEYHSNRIYPRDPQSWSFEADQFRIEPDDLIVGVMPELSLGRGKEVMHYFTPAEELSGVLANIDESGAMGHIVPDHEIVLQRGIGGQLAELRKRLEGSDPGDVRDFYQSAIDALEGVQGWCNNYGWLARQMAADQTDAAAQKNLLTLAARIEKVAVHPPESLAEAIQLVFVMHCCIHLVGNPVAIGRLDQLLDREYAVETADAEAQELLDALWVKLGEKALHNRAHATDHLNIGTTAVAYSAGNFAQGGGINQWVQQLTIGGYRATDGAPEGGCNRYTLMALKSSRRLPLNAPCLSLRLYDGMPDAVVREAVLALLSGGAHPILFHDDRMVQALHENAGFSLRDARNYACDGCYEPMIAGATEFAFGNVAPLDAVACAMNRGAKILSAGTVYLRGWKASFPSPPPEEIATFEQFYGLFARHLYYLSTGFFTGVLSNYGRVWDFCPSPLLSTMIEGCIDSGRDLSNGGARLHLIAPMYVGSANAIDSLYAIQKMVYDPETAVTTLPELLRALWTDWGHAVGEPWVSDFAGPVSHQETARRYQELREVALALPKWGSGHADVNALGQRVMETIVETAHRVFEDPQNPLAPILADLRTRYTTPGRLWRMHMQVGIGTFEGYVGDGLGNGASADGRRNGQPYASDFSPVPAPSDRPAVPQDPDAPGAAALNRPIYDALSGYDVEAINTGISNAAPVDLNVREDFPPEELEQFIRAYMAGEVGSNLLTVTVADPDTYAAAAQQPERYELVRVRMGGWSEYFAAMFPAHQSQHARRPFFIPQPRPKRPAAGK